MLEANAWHHRSDVLSTGVVMVALIGSQFGAAWIDTVAAVIVGLMVGKVGWDLLWESGRELVDTALPVATQEEMRQMAMSVPGVHGIHDLRTRQSAGRTMLDLHVVVPPRISVSEGHEIGNEVSRRLRNGFPSLTDLTFHIDPEDDSGEGIPAASRACRCVPRWRPPWPGAGPPWRCGRRSARWNCTTWRARSPW